jgi:hypothetical protein
VRNSSLVHPRLGGAILRRKSNGAKPITEATGPMLHRTVEERSCLH